MPGHTKPLGSDSDANFVGWQETLSGKSFPLFNITIADHPLYRSTVSDETLRRLHLRVPRTLTSDHDMRETSHQSKLNGMDAFYYHKRVDHALDHMSDSPNIASSGFARYGQPLFANKKREPNNRKGEKTWEQY